MVFGGTIFIVFKKSEISKACLAVLIPNRFGRTKQL